MSAPHSDRTILSSEEESAFHVLETRLRTILPEGYQDRYETLEPVSMGSAALQYGKDGKVAWGEIWDSFCDLAMAGGPPHKGALLEPGSAADIKERRDEYRWIVEEIIRGIRLASDVAVAGSVGVGWVRLDCGDRTMAAWLLRAVTMENISCRGEGTTIDVPAGPRYRIEKEVKNVITAIAKTSHYWSGHIGRAQKDQIRRAFEQMASEVPLVQPALIGIDCAAEAHDLLYETMVGEIRRMTGYPISSYRYAGWVGIVCPSVRGAVWMMRMLTAMNVLARRERTELFVPVNPATDGRGEIVTTAALRAHRFAQGQAVL